MLLIICDWTFYLYLYTYKRNNGRPDLERPTRHSEKFHGKRWSCGQKNVRFYVPVRWYHQTSSWQLPVA